MFHNVMNSTIYDDDFAKLDSRRYLRFTHKLEMSERALAHGLVHAETE